MQDYNTEYFNCPIGVKQGDCLSPTLFSVYINDLSHELKNSGIGVEIEFEGIAGITETIVVNMLLYADDIVLFVKDEIDKQHLLYLVQIWCENWRLEINLSKTNVIHVRSKRKQQSKFMFLFNRS